jgi:hypothetical protein
MSTLITYDSVNVFSGQPTPFVGMSKENIYYGERWAAVERITLLGQLTGCTYSGILQTQNNLINNFSKNFKSLVIDTGTFTNIVINSISFPSTNYVKIIPYQIELSYYPEESFYGTYGVLDPSDSWSYNQGEDGIIEIIHEISARGIQTASGYGALNNAKNFVLSRSGFNNYILPKFIKINGVSGASGITSLSAILKSQSEKINRFNATYSIVENYTSDQFYPSEYGILRYTIENGLNQAGFNSASIQGDFQGGMNDDFSLIKNRANNFDYYSSVMTGIGSSITLNTIPLSKQITENTNLRKINFNLTYNDNPSGQTNLISNISISSGTDLISVTVNGEVNGRGGLKDKWEKVQTTFSSFSPYSAASGAFVTYAGSGAKLNPYSKSESVTKDSFNGTISFDYSYQDSPVSPSSNLFEFNYEINVKPQLRKIIILPLISKIGSSTGYKYEVTDMGLDNRGQLSINGNSIPNRQITGAATLVATKAALSSLFTAYSTGYTGIYLEKYNLTSSNNENLAFNTEWSFNSIGAINETNYSIISSL